MSILCKGVSSMFTGLIECVGTIVDTRPTTGGARLRVEAGQAAGECTLGASVCVSGVCLTVTDSAGEILGFDVVRETLERSTLGSKRTGDRVNLERSLRIGDRLGGHFVQGHIDGTAVIDRSVSSSREYVLWLRPEEPIARYIVPKGSVAVDGVSLTVAAVEARGFSVALIPTTLAATTLSSVGAGDRVNIETDIITRTIVHRLSELSAGEGLSLRSLKEAGLA